MVAITASMVKELRERTQVGMMDCKKALVTAQGDMELAIENLRKSSGLKAAKKAGRIASDGLVGIQVAEDSSLGVMVEVNCETDFAARDENFTAFVQTVVDRVFKSRETSIEALLPTGLESERESLVQKIGENISIRRAEVYSDPDVYSYVHTNSKIGVLLSMEGGDRILGRDLAMHIAAVEPLVLNPSDVPEDVIAREREIYTAQAGDSGKPPEIAAKMIEGKLRKYMADISLTEQPFVKDSNIRVGALLKKANARVTGFVRYEVGEGIDKGPDDFAAEVAAQLS
ncbi:MAG: translation elongation factor Ts [Gammaproteobacteria bacterium]|nr:translation elongation factor Ts [Gammaproteobacteria bacterium]